ncbi:uncharacterized protein TNCV_1643281 [Trichonephila clavipes]|nr:uncharacterized protein TNCV_1643281 [Trichonephila clavipes]
MLPQCLKQTSRKSDGCQKSAKGRDRLGRQAGGSSYCIPEMCGMLQLWPSGKRYAVMFETPMIWREPQNHHDDCYFCVVKINGINPGNRNKWSYPNLSSAQRPQSKSREVQPSTSKSSNDPNPCDPKRNT